MTIRDILTLGLPLSAVVEGGEVTVDCVGLKEFCFRVAPGRDFSQSQAYQATFLLILNRRLHLSFGRVGVAHALSPRSLKFWPSVVLKKGHAFEIDIDPYLEHALEPFVKVLVTVEDAIPLLRQYPFSLLA